MILKEVNQTTSLIRSRYFGGTYNFPVDACKLHGYDLKFSDIRETEVFVSYPKSAYPLQPPLGLLFKLGIFSSSSNSKMPLGNFLSTNKTQFQPYLGFW